MKNAVKLTREKLGPVVWGYLEIRDEENVSPCVCGIASIFARVATLSGMCDQFDMEGYDVDWRIWDAMPNEWERKALSWKNAEQTRLA